MKKHLLWIALPWVLTACGGSGGNGSNGGGVPEPVYAASIPGECPAIEGTFVQTGPEFRGHGRGGGRRGAVMNIRRDGAGFLIIQSEERHIRLHSDGQTRGGNEGSSFSICTRGRVSGQATGRHGERRSYLILPVQGGLSVTITDANGTPDQLFFGRP